MGFAGSAEIGGDMKDPVSVLIVDDDVRERERVKSTLRATDPDVQSQEETNCADALKALRSRSFDCVLLDQELPDAPGLCLLLEAKENGIDVPMVVLSEGADDQLAVELMKAGAADYLNKDSVTPSAIGRSIRTAIRMHRIEQEKRQVEESLEESQERFRLLVDGAKDYALFMLSTDGAVVSWNPGAQRLFGYAEEEVVGKPASVIYSEEDRLAGIPEDERTDASEHGRAEDTRWYVRRDGSRFWGDSLITALRDERSRLRGFGMLMRDATERRQMEQLRAEETKRQKTFLRDILASVTDGALHLCLEASELPAPLPEAARLILTQDIDLASLRSSIRSVGEANHFDPLLTNDLIIAGSEAAMNAVVHAGGGEARVCVDENAIQVWIEDHGKGIDMEQIPHATLERGYTTAGTLGQGFKMILQTVDRSWLLTGPLGTRVVLEKFRQTPDPEWMQARKIASRP